MPRAYLVDLIVEHLQQPQLSFGVRELHLRTDAWRGDRWREGYSARTVRAHAPLLIRIHQHDD